MAKNVMYIIFGIVAMLFCLNEWFGKEKYRTSRITVGILWFSVASDFILKVIS